MRPSRRPSRSAWREASRGRVSSTTRGESAYRCRVAVDASFAFHRRIEDAACDERLNCVARELYHSNPSPMRARSFARAKERATDLLAHEIPARLEWKAHREQSSNRGRCLKSEGQRMGHRLRLLVDDRSWEMESLPKLIVRSSCCRANARVVRGTQMGIGKEVDCDVMRVVLLGCDFVVKREKACGGCLGTQRR